MINPNTTTASIRIIAAATVIAACYVASSVIITLICSIFLVGVRYALLVMPLCAFLNLIPYIGKL